MKAKEQVKRLHINLLIAMHGENFFKQDQFSLPLSVRTPLCDMANEVGYKRPRNSYGSLGMVYYEHLKKIWRKNNESK